jgi:cation diffusion facilitator CzcD-associated flavoprotein CzcO
LNNGARFVEGRVVRVSEDAAVLEDGSEIPADYIVLATGYDAEAIAFEVVGETDATSNYTSRADWTMYRGIALPGLPNFFTVFGNNMYLNHSGCFVGQLTQSPCRACSRSRPRTLRASSARCATTACASCLSSPRRRRGTSAGSTPGCG